ncbi:MAG: superoxide dismutase [Hyphomicrobiaceae bacterium]
MNRRQAVQLVVGASLTAAAPALNGRRSRAEAQTIAPPAFALPPLGYGFDALEPHIDAQTMRIHHGTHHAAYVRNINAIVAANPALAGIPMAKTLRSIEKLPEAIQAGVRDNMGGHWNHSFFWRLMKPGGPSQPSGKLKEAITGTFGSLSAMQRAVNEAGLARFGSGWVWLGVGPRGQLTVVSTSNQDTPHMVSGIRGAVLGIDLWEHAYYLKHQAARGAYLTAWWNVVNWDTASETFDHLLS